MSFRHKNPNSVTDWVWNVQEAKVDCESLLVDLYAVEDQIFCFLPAVISSVSLLSNSQSSQLSECELNGCNIKILKYSLKQLKHGKSHILVVDVHQFRVVERCIERPLSHRKKHVDGVKMLEKAWMMSTKSANSESKTLLNRKTKRHKRKSSEGKPSSSGVNLYGSGDGDSFIGGCHESNNRSRRLSHSVSESRVTPDRVAEQDHTSQETEARQGHKSAETEANLDHKSTETERVSPETVQANLDHKSTETEANLDHTSAEREAQLDHNFQCYMRKLLPKASCCVITQLAKLTRDEIGRRKRGKEAALAREASREQSRPSDSCARVEPQQSSVIRTDHNTVPSSSNTSHTVARVPTFQKGPSIATLDTDRRSAVSSNSRPSHTATSQSGPSGSRTDTNGELTVCSNSRPSHTATKVLTSQSGPSGARTDKDREPTACSSSRPSHTATRVPTSQPGPSGLRTGTNRELTASPSSRPSHIATRVPTSQSGPSGARSDKDREPTTCLNSRPSHTATRVPISQAGPSGLRTDTNGELTASSNSRPSHTATRVPTSQSGPSCARTDTNGELTASSSSQPSHTATRVPTSQSGSTTSRQTVKPSELFKKPGSVKTKKVTGLLTSILAAPGLQDIFTGSLPPCTNIVENKDADVLRQQLSIRDGCNDTDSFLDHLTPNALERICHVTLPVALTPRTSDQSAHPVPSTSRTTVQASPTEPDRLKKISTPSVSVQDKEESLRMRGLDSCPVLSNLEDEGNRIEKVCTVSKKSRKVAAKLADRDQVPKGVKVVVNNDTSLTVSQSLAGEKRQLEEVSGESNSEPPRKSPRLISNDTSLTVSQSSAGKNLDEVSGESMSKPPHKSPRLQNRESSQSDDCLILDSPDLGTKKAAKGRRKRKLFNATQTFLEGDKTCPKKTRAVSRLNLNRSDQEKKRNDKDVVNLDEGSHELFSSGEQSKAPTQSDGPSNKNTCHKSDSQKSSGQISPEKSVENSAEADGRICVEFCQGQLMESEVQKSSGSSAGKISSGTTTEPPSVELLEISAGSSIETRSQSSHSNVDAPMKEVKEADNLVESEKSEQNESLLKRIFGSTISFFGRRKSGTAVEVMEPLACSTQKDASRDEQSGKLDLSLGELDSEQARSTPQEGNSSSLFSSSGAKSDPLSGGSKTDSSSRELERLEDNVIHSASQDADVSSQSDEEQEKPKRGLQNPRGQAYSQDADMESQGLEEVVKKKVRRKTKKELAQISPEKKTQHLRSSDDKSPKKKRQVQAIPEDYRKAIGVTLKVPQEGRHRSPRKKVAFKSRSPLQKFWVDLKVPSENREANGGNLKDQSEGCCRSPRKKLVEFSPSYESQSTPTEKVGSACNVEGDMRENRRVTRHMSKVATGSCRLNKGGKPHGCSTGKVATGSSCLLNKEKPHGSSTGKGEHFKVRETEYQRMTCQRGKIADDGKIDSESDTDIFVTPQVILSSPEEGQGASLGFEVSDDSLSATGAFTFQPSQGFNIQLCPDVIDSGESLFDGFQSQGFVVNSSAVER